eukprot:CAMPEP_0168340662 /NCGR_PEP_ID=MMETSP0213-20121227/14196_1 /TAXON_ID=151035 /ORGANISM="Euplotes harpa, Strain FSP1.4" /LENGTH=51 /DNA_ID=CAMNT_0008346939 /DNA_START=22 /DNA_END=177 /DNA_ORIENTATION=-
MILKMMGFIAIDDGIEHDIEAYLANMKLIKSSYHKDDNGVLSSAMKDFLDC